MRANIGSAIFSPSVRRRRCCRSRTASSMLAIVQTSVACSRAAAFAAVKRPLGSEPRRRCSRSALRCVSSDATTYSRDASSSGAESSTTEKVFLPPWSIIPNRDKASRGVARFRQHVNPLSRRYRMEADLPDGWPECAYDDPSLPLYLDIGCGKGGFLLDLVAKRHGSGTETETETGGNGEDESDAGDGREGGGVANDEDMPLVVLPPEMNYLGLEIRPGVAQYAQSRVEKRGLSGRISFVGCNANVDLDRILQMYRRGGCNGGDGSGDGDEAGGEIGRLAVASIQYPDPHFKKQQAKRRVVTPELISTLARYAGEGTVVFLQSDVQDVLDDIRSRFREYGTAWFADEIGDAREYLPENPLGVPTEREVSVLNKGLPVYRTLFRRNGQTVVD